jgi:hypothetical protein
MEPNKQKININVEGGELLLQSEEGHYAVVPAKDRSKVREMIDNNCEGCINEYIQTLPKESDYAEDGTLIPDPPDKPEGMSFGTKIKNIQWGGLKNYSGEGSFDRAYATARKNGVKTFVFDDKVYNSDMKGTPEEQMRWSGITNDQIFNRNPIQEKIFRNLIPWGYDEPIKRVEEAISQEVDDPDFPDYPEGQSRYDAWRLYMGHPQKSNTFKTSKYRPLTSKNDDKTYYSFAKNDRERSDNFENRILINLLDESLYQGISHKDKSNNEYFTDVDAIMGVMGTFKISKGKDEHGTYLSYYDKWDLNPLGLKTKLTGEISTDIGKPLEIYDRIYYRPNPKYAGPNEKSPELKKIEEEIFKVNTAWMNNETIPYPKEFENFDEYSEYLLTELERINADELKKHGPKYIRSYYSDKELLQLDPKKKDFDVLELQRELSNRGYNFPKSTKKSGDLDGTWGDETEAALLDYQSKHKVALPKAEHIGEKPTITDPETGQKIQ